MFVIHMLVCTYACNLCCRSENIIVLKTLYFRINDLPMVRSESKASMASDDEEAQ